MAYSQDGLMVGLLAIDQRGANELATASDLGTRALRNQ
jgi:hypothetical protein